MATGRDVQLARQIGEHLVAAELGRLGYIATPFAGNVPLFDLLIANPSGQAVPVQVKTIRSSSPTWQMKISAFLDIELVDGMQIVRGKKELPNPNLLCFLVRLGDRGQDEFYILRLSDLSEHFARTYRGGRRPKNPESMHCAVSPRDLARFHDNWQLVSEILNGDSKQRRQKASPRLHDVTLTPSRPAPAS